MCQTMIRKPRSKNPPRQCPRAPCMLYPCNSVRRTLTTRCITRFDLYAVCTDAIHSVALWTRVTSHVLTCAQCVPTRSTPQHVERAWHHTCTIGAVRCDVRAVRTDAVHSVALWPRETSRFDMCAVCTNAVHYIIALWTRITSDVWTCVQCVLSQDMFGHVQSMYGSRLGHVRILGFSASPGEFGFSASRLRSGNSASRLLGFARGIRLLGFSASLGEFGFSASRLRSGNSASRLLGSPPLPRAPFTAAM